MKNIVKFVIPLVLVIAIPLILFLQKTENDLQKYDRISQTVFETFNPTGLSIAIVQDGAIIYEKSFGYKNIPEMDFMDSDAIFNIASCSKAFTSAAIGKLVQEGLLSWDDKVTDYIPNFKLADDYITNNLTIRDILSHRSGFGTFYGDLLWYNTNYSNKEVIERMQYIPFTYDFRTKFGYQNNMFSIAGEIVQNITGLTWEEFIQETFLDPLEMSSTRTSSDQFNGTENIAYPHYCDSVLEIYHFNAAKPAASMWSNTHDLANWATMWLNNGKFKNQEILSPDIINTILNPHTILPVSEERESLGFNFRDYALGWGVYDYNGIKVIEHNGGMPGYISKLTLLQKKNMAIVILNNGFDEYVNNALLYSIIDIIRDNNSMDWIDYYLTKKQEANLEETELTNKRLETKNTDILPSIAIKEFIGIYNDKMYGNAEISEENNQLICTFIPAKEVFTSKMEHWNNNTFKIEFKDPFLSFGLINFELDNKNNVLGFKIDLPSNDFHFKNLIFKKIK